MRIGSSNEFGCLVFSKYHNSNIVFILSEEAKITQTIKVNIEKKFQLLTCTGTKNSDKYFFSGTFTTSWLQTVSEGIFMITTQGDKCLKSETHNFLLSMAL